MSGANRRRCCAMFGVFLLFLLLDPTKLKISLFWGHQNVKRRFRDGKLEKFGTLYGFMISKSSKFRYKEVLESNIRLNSVKKFVFDLKIE